VLIGCASAVVAVVLALAATVRPRGAGHPLHLAVRGLRRLHSGHLGDYVAWLTLGVAVLCVTLAAQM